MPAHPRVAVSASSMAGLTSSFSSLQIARGTRSLSTHTQTAAPLPRTTPSPRTALSLSARRPALAPRVSIARPSVPSAASFSTTAPVQRIPNIRRHKMRLYFKDQGKKYKFHDPESPLIKTFAFRFPLNPDFKVDKVLSDASRNYIWSRVVREGTPLKTVAVEMSVDVRRVAAAARLKELERAWILQGKPLATPYRKAIESMLPTFTYSRQNPTFLEFEPINEISTHPHAAQQIFLPVPESRYFTRKDAARALHPDLLPADERMPIPELIDVARNPDHVAADAAMQKVFSSKEEEFLLLQKKRDAATTKRTTKFDTGRFQFRIRDYNAERVGKTGRLGSAVGWRYGVPPQDRKRGQVKIPTTAN